MAPPGPLAYPADHKTVSQYLVGAGTVSGAALLELGLERALGEMPLANGLTTGQQLIALTPFVAPFLSVPLVRHLLGPAGAAFTRLLTAKEPGWNLRQLDGDLEELRPLLDGDGPLEPVILFGQTVKLPRASWERACRLEARAYGARDARDAGQVRAAATIRLQLLLAYYPELVSALVARDWAPDGLAAASAASQLLDDYRASFAASARPGWRERGRRLERKAAKTAVSLAVGVRDQSSGVTIGNMAQGALVTSAAVLGMPGLVGGVRSTFEAKDTIDELRAEDRDEAERARHGNWPQTLDRYALGNDHLPLPAPVLSPLEQAPSVKPARRTSPGLSLG